MKWLAALAAATVLSQQAWGQGSVDLQRETLRLEGMKKRGDITTADERRLSEIYFLTSRCEDVRRMLGNARTPLNCACGGMCPKSEDIDRLERFRALLSKGTGWGDARVQALWKKVSHMPEARYFALKSFRSGSRYRRDARIRPLRADLEQSLESLEVKP